MVNLKNVKGMNTEIGNLFLWIENLESDLEIDETTLQEVICKFMEKWGKDYNDFLYLEPYKGTLYVQIGIDSIFYIGMSFDTDGFLSKYTYYHCEDDIKPFCSLDRFFENLHYLFDK